MKTSEIKLQLLKDFRNGIYRCGDRIPPEKDLVERFQVSRSTLREVISSLVEEGLLERRQGSGTYLKRLSRDCNPLIGVMVAHIEGIETIFARLVQNLERELAGHGYSIVLGSHNDDPVKAQQQIERFAKLKVAGIVIVPIQLPRAEDSNLALMRMLGTAEIPFVLADSQVSARTNSWFSCVSVNNFQGMRQLVKYLYSLGHRRIAHIKGLPGVYSSEVRYDGYCEAMRECGLPVLPEYIKEIKIGPVQYQGQSEIRELLKLSEPPTAITCVHDLVAGNVINELCQVGLEVPADISIAGFDNIPVPGIEPGFLTTVEQPVGKMAQAAVSILLHKIDGTMNGEVQQGIECPLKIGKSCDKIINRISVNTKTIARVL